MKTPIRRWLLAAVVAGGLRATGCGGDDDPLEGCDAVAAESCRRLQECAPSYLERSYGSLDRCKQTRLAYCQQTEGIPGSRTTGDTLAACLAASDRSCETLFGDRRGLAVPEACRPIPGELADGEPCAHDVQCQSTSCSGGASTCGVCEPLRKRAAEGEPCGSDAGCEELLTCPSDGVCFRPQGAGAACHEDRQCLSPLWCSSRKVCEARGTRQAGEACDDGLQCDVAAQLYCVEGVCTGLRIVGEGEACDDGMSLCRGGLHCADDRRCAPDLADGEACADGGPPCTLPATCQHGRCVVLSEIICE